LGTIVLRARLAVGRGENKPGRAGARLDRSAAFVWMPWALACSVARLPIAMSFPPASPQSRWFTEEVQPHEPALRAYLHRRFPEARDVDDLVQESYLRVLRARETGPIASAKAYLFTTARHLALALFRRPKIFSHIPVTDPAASGIIQEGADVIEQVSTTQEVALLLDAIDALPNRCREIFILRKLQSLSQKEIAAQLGLSEQTVQVQVGRGARKCAEFLRRRGVTGRFGHELESRGPISPFAAVVGAKG
jgi:RNA polymerase sigma factor (sigma-70 family)